MVFGISIRRVSLSAYRQDIEDACLRTNGAFFQAREGKDRGTPRLVNRGFLSPWVQDKNLLRQTRRGTRNAFLRSDEKTLRAGECKRRSVFRCNAMEIFVRHPGSWISCESEGTFLDRGCSDNRSGWQGASAESAVGGRLGEPSRSTHVSVGARQEVPRCLAAQPSRRSEASFLRNAHSRSRDAATRGLMAWSSLSSNDWPAAGFSAPNM